MKHTLRITNPTGEGTLTKVELDGEEQFVSGFSLTYNIDRQREIEARLFYPWAAVEADLDAQAIEAQYSVRLHVVGWPGIREFGAGKTLAAALRDLAEKVDVP